MALVVLSPDLGYGAVVLLGDAAGVFFCYAFLIKALSICHLFKNLRSKFVSGA